MSNNHSKDSVAASNAPLADEAVVYYPPGHAQSYCVKCRKSIQITDPFRRINGRMYHTACITCGKCKKVVKDDFAWCDRGKALICHVCRGKTDLICLKCRKPIHEPKPVENTDGDGHYWHKDHFKCGLCTEPLKRAVATVVIGKAYHRLCVRCQDCVEKLAHKVYNVLDSKMTCDACFKNRFYPDCGKCRKRITSTGYSVNNVFWHVECLRCEACQKMISVDKIDKCVASTGADKSLFCSMPCAERLCEKCNQVKGVEGLCPCNAAPTTYIDTNKGGPPVTMNLVPKKSPSKGGRASRSKTRERQKSVGKDRIRKDSVGKDRQRGGRNTQAGGGRRQASVDRRRQASVDRRRPDRRRQDSVDRKRQRSKDGSRSGSKYR